MGRPSDSRAHLFINNIYIIFFKKKVRMQCYGGINFTTFNRGILIIMENKKEHGDVYLLNKSNCIYRGDPIRWKLEDKLRIDRYFITIN